MTNSINLSPPISYATTSGIDPTSDDAVMSGTLTPDALMTYCQTRLDSIDSQITGAFNEQQLQSKQTTDLTATMNGFQAYSSTGTGANPEVVKGLEQQLYDYVTNLQKEDPGSPQLPGLIKTFDNVLGSGTGGPFTAASGDKVDFIDLQHNTPSNFDKDSNLGSTEISQYVQSMQDALSGFNSSAQLQMIQVQSLMSQRQTAVTLTTNLVQSLGDQSNKIADNIGH